MQDIKSKRRKHESKFMRKVVAIIEARMSSERLPGKVLLDIAGKPSLQHLIERLQKAKKLSEIVIATTINKKDDSIVKFAEDFGIRFYRGSEEDVLERVVKAAESVRADIIVEVTGDCPLLCPEVIEQALGIYLSGDYDVVANVRELSYPQGVDVQVFSYEKLKDISEKTNDPAHREHVSLYFYEKPEKYRICHLEAPAEFHAPHLRFQLDYEEDLRFIREIYEALYKEKADFNLKDIFELLKKRPELEHINSHMREKSVR